MQTDWDEMIVMMLMISNSPRHVTFRGTPVKDLKEVYG
jgi:hypothetical protein